jgi:hypothetical protein
VWMGACGLGNQLPMISTDVAPLTPPSILDARGFRG